MSVEVPRRSALSYDDFREQYLCPGRPVIITDALDGWRALDRWTPEFFQQEFGDVRLTLRDTMRPQIGYAATHQSVDYSMAGFIDDARASTPQRPAPYLRNCALAELLPSLVEDARPLPAYCEPNWLTEPFLVPMLRRHLNRGAAMEIYVGGAGAAFPLLHYDGAGTHAFLMQVYGEKEYVVYPPDQTPYLYPSPTSRNLSRVADLDAPDLQQFPRFAEARGGRFRLRRGEMLFVPARWWHTARIVSLSITLSVNTANESNWSYLVDDLVANRRNPIVALCGRAYLQGAGAWRRWRDSRRTVSASNTAGLVSPATRD